MESRFADTRLISRFRKGVKEKKGRTDELKYGKKGEKRMTAGRRGLETGRSRAGKVRGRK